MPSPKHDVQPDAQQALSVDRSRRRLVGAAAAAAGTALLGAPAIA